jgi:hypothetical protein
MTDLRKLARGEPCMIRLPGICTGDRDQTVLAHVRMAGISGMGRKSPDLLGAWACFACHLVVDGQQEGGMGYEERRLALLEGVMRTQAELIKRGVVRW